MSNQSQVPEFISDELGSDCEITLAPRIVKLTTRTGVDIRRTLPHKHIRTIGAWCFVDHYGPTDQAHAMSVAAHPHTGLQTVSWLFTGEIEHRDSLGSNQKVSPGELNIMTSGIGIAHSELSVNDQTLLHGVQLWTVLPDRDRNTKPAFNHYSDLPIFGFENLKIQLFVGEMFAYKSHAKVFSELVGAEMDVLAGATSNLPINEDFEYGILVVAGDVKINAKHVPLGNLHYLPAGKTSMRIASSSGAKIVLLGGVPFDEKIVMWWNFIGRSHDEIVEMRNAWEMQSERFPSFEDRIGGRIPAPVLPNLRLSPRGNLR